MALDLEIVGKVTEVTEADIPPKQTQSVISKLRETHHAAAKALARGLSDFEICATTGYSYDRLQTLKRDPMFRELIESYKRQHDDAAIDVEARFLGISLDTAAVLHERILDEPEAVSTQVALDMFKAFADRAGFAPVQRSVNTNINRNIAERLDAAKRKREAA